MITYLTGCSNDATRAAQRSDLGLLGTPAGSTIKQRHHYETHALDNGVYGEKTRPADWREVRYGPGLGGSFDVTNWLSWLDEQPRSALFAVLPDVIGNAAASWQRTAPFITRVAQLGFVPAFVMQNGLEDIPFVWRSMLNAAEHTGGVLFIGGSPECKACSYVRPVDEYKITHCPTCSMRLAEWKLSAVCAQLVNEAKQRGLWVHMGRVNSLKRLRYAQSIGCDSADGTYAKWAKNVPTMLSWLDELNGDDRPTLTLITNNNPEGTDMTKAKSTKMTCPKHAGRYVHVCAACRAANDPNAAVPTTDAGPKSLTDLLQIGGTSKSKKPTTNAEHKQAIAASTSIDELTANLQAAAEHVESKKTPTKGTPPAVDYSKLDRIELSDLAKEDHAALKAARAAKRPLPATPALDELHRRAPEMASKTSKQRSGKTSGTGTGRVKIDDDKFAKLIVEQMTKGVDTPQRVINRLREAGHSGSLKRVRAVFDDVLAGKREGVDVAAIKAAFKAAVDSKKPAAAKPAASTSKQTTTAAAKKTSKPAVKQTPGSKARETAKPAASMSTSSARAKQGVTPTPKKQAAKKSTSKSTKSTAKKTAGKATTKAA